MASTDDMLSEVRVFVKNCPDVTVRYALQRAIQEFCRESWCYQRSVQLTPVANQEVYVLAPSDPPDDVLQVRSVMYNNVPLVPKRGKDSLPAPFSTGGNQPYEYVYEYPNLLMVKPVPTNIINPSTGDPYEFFVRAILCPQDNQEHVPDVIYRNHKIQVIAGAIAFCMRMPQEVWSNPQEAASHEASFRYGYNEAKRKQMSQEKSMRIRPRSFLTSGG